MLQYKIVDEPTLGILIKLNNSALFKNYRLAGDTALALLYGHTKSIDLDFFGIEKIDTDELITFLNSTGKLREVKTSKRIVSLFLDDVKINIVCYPYDWIDSPLVEENIRLASSKEIAAMKIAAIINRGTKIYFVDLNELLKIFSLQQIFDFILKSLLTVLFFSH